MFLTTSDNKRLYYEITGNATSPQTMVLLNGLTQATASWSLLLPFFDKTYRILLVDFIFQGQSEKTGEWRTFDQHAADITALIKATCNTPVIVAGLSYGSLVAQHLAVNHPAMVRALVLISTFAHKTAYYEAVENAWWQALEKGGYNLMLDIMLPSVLSEGYFENPLIPIEVMKEMRTKAGKEPGPLFALMRATKERKDYRTTLKTIKCPTLIIQGEKDLLLPVHLAEEVHNSISGSEIFVIKNAGHTLNLEHVTEVCAIMKDFLQRKGL
jgi:3-oxoadipate enol-lactonase